MTEREEIEAEFEAGLREIIPRFDDATLAAVSGVLLVALKEPKTLSEAVKNETLAKIVASFAVMGLREARKYRR